MAFLWKLHDPEGNDLRSSDEFDSQQEAEAWMGREWAALLDEGADSVSLLSDGDVVYRMGLHEE